MSGVWSKVKAAGAGAGLGSLTGTFLVWLLGATAWGAGASAEQVEAALAAVPAPVSGLLVALVGAAGAVLAGYAATERVGSTLVTARHLRDADEEPQAQVAAAPAREVATDGEQLAVETSARTREADA